MKKLTEKSNRGGKREGAGRKPGATKMLATVSVDADALARAMKKWGGSRSALFNQLLLDYAGGPGTPR